MKLPYVPGLRFWVEVDKGLVTSGSLVTGWKDLSGCGFHLDRCSPNPPKLVRNVINKWSGVKFESANLNYLVHSTAVDILSSVRDFSFGCLMKFNAPEPAENETHLFGNSSYLGGFGWGLSNWSAKTNEFVDTLPDGSLNNSDNPFDRSTYKTYIVTFTNGQIGQMFINGININATGGPKWVDGGATSSTIYMGARITDIHPNSTSPSQNVFDPQQYGDGTFLGAFLSNTGSIDVQAVHNYWKSKYLVRQEPTYKKAWWFRRGKITSTSISGTIAANLPGLTGGATLSEQFRGTASALLPGLTANANAAFGYSATINCSLPGLTGASVVTEGFKGSIVAQLPGIDATANTSTGLFANINANAPDLVADVDMLAGIVANISVTI